MSEDTRVVINAGGKLFETSTTTLLASGSVSYTHLTLPTKA